ALKNPAKTTGTTGKLKEFGKGCWPSGKKYYCRGAVQRVKKTNGIYGWLVSCEAVVAVKSTKISRTRYRISARVPSRLGCELKGIKSKARIPSWAGTTAYGRIESAYTVAALVAAADNLR